MDQPGPSRDSMAAIRFMSVEEVRRYPAVPCKRRPNRLDGYGFFGFRASNVPLITAFDALSELAPRLIGFHLGPKIPAFRAFLGYRLVPADEVAVRVIRTAVKRLSSLLRPALGDL